MNQQIDIIVPVYNGLEEVKQCVESIKRCTDLNRHRLILVDDKSPDSRILPYLKSIATESIHIIESPVNEGFSASVNKGMQYSKRDVILLNSDTIVTKNWVEKLICCAYSKRAAATVTPLSNAATLCSVPEFLRDNKVPEGYTVEEMGQLVEACSLKRYPRISVAVGFCMYIKREVLDNIGYFDAETFGKGYGEENDFCHRAEKQGYIHLMCDDTFIYHKGTASFESEEKQKLLVEHEKILRQRHEAYVLQNGRYCEKNPNKDLQENIKLYLLLDPRKCGKLYLTEELSVEKQTTEEKVFYAVRRENRILVTAYHQGQQVEFRFPAPIIGVQPAKACEEEEQILLDLMKAFHITQVEQKGKGNFAQETQDTLKKAILEERAVDTKMILRGFLLAQGSYLSDNEAVDGLYSIPLKDLTEKYEKLSQEDKVKGEEIYNIYHSKRFKLACAMEKLVRPLKK